MVTQRLIQRLRIYISVISVNMQDQGTHCVNTNNLYMKGSDIPVISVNMPDQGTHCVNTKNLCIKKSDIPVISVNILRLSLES